VRVAPAGRQRGLALAGLLALFTVGATWWLVSALNAPVNRTTSERVHNAKVLQQAKTALIGYAAQKASMPGENDPGSLPCPEAKANIGTTNEGIAASVCTLPAVGRLPWRTLGLPKLFDASGEPLWYVASPGWAKPNSTTNTVINSESAAQLVLDAAADIVALVIAPGRPLAVQASANCTARNQARTTPSSTIDFRDYLECQNASSPADSAFASTGPDGSFNDQVLAVAALEMLPGVEAAVASRFARELGSNMRYCGGLWPACTSAVHLPFAADFGDPAVSSFQGVVNKTQGLLPVSFSGAGPCLANTPAAPYCAPPPACGAAPYDGSRCAPTLVTYRNNPVVTKTGGPNVTLVSSPCSVAGTPSTLTCTLTTYSPATTPVEDRWMTFTMDVTSNNVGMAVRKINDKVKVTGVDTAMATAVNYPYGYIASAPTMNADPTIRGSVTMRITSRVPGASGGLVSDLICGLSGFLGLFNDCYQHTITLPFMWVDEPMLYASNVTLAWFYRNNWHQLMYYAVSAGNAPSGGGNCVAGTSCLSITGRTTTNTHRSLVVTPGRAVGTQARPPAAVADWLEGGNANLPPAEPAPLPDAFWARDPALPVNRAFNDHVVAIDSN
jgi:hypothetical protein